MWRFLRASVCAGLVALAALAPAAAQEQVVPGALLQPANGNSQAFIPYGPTYPLATTSVASPAGTAGLTPIVGGSALSGLVLKAAPGNMYSIYAVCTAACWLMVFNSVTIPGNGATTAGTASGNLTSCIPIGAGGIGSVSYAPGPPEAFSVGISAAISSTSCATLTLSATAFIHALVQ